MDQRDRKTWIALELSRQGEIKVMEGSLESLLRRDLGVDSTHPIFIPARTYSKRGKKITHHLMEGYAFIASGLPEASYYKLENKPYVTRVMSVHGTHGARVLQTLADDMIVTLQNQLQELVSSDVVPGTIVRVLEGTYETLEGYVLDVEGDEAGVYFEFRSLNVIAYIPRIFLEGIG